MHARGSFLLSATIYFMKLQTYLEETKHLIDDALVDFFLQRKKLFTVIDPTLVELLDAVTAQTLRSGKRIRPFLARIGYELAGGSDLDKITQLGVSLELLHQYFMVHDDIVDRDEKRYGADSLHVAYQKKFAERYHQNDSHLGLSLGLIGGDLLQTLSSQALMEVSCPEVTKQLLTQKMLDTIYETTAGWQIHFFMNYEPVAQVDAALFLKGMELVSARYTFEAPLMMGMLLASGPDYSDSLKKYAYHTGMAFQIRDDLLGMFGDTNIIGKPVGNDYREGKKTLLVLHTYQNSTNEQKLFIENTLGKDIDQSTLLQVLKLMKETGALDHSNSIAHQHILKAKEALLSLPQTSSQTQLLSELSDWVLQRDR